ncbi:SDR family oxidoreductase [Pleurocapsales cyanobacterium LEGE 10410]|nr:SDR family oxidoreductase [Pleurocapsales cyanobacterium LEGE 10410]
MFLGARSEYTQSKWVAEQLVTIARDRNIPVTIHRPGRISGHSKTGVCNPNDHTFRMIRGCIQLGSVSLNDSLVNLIPVDYAVEAIVHLASQAESIGKTFHLFNPQPTPWNEVAKLINSLGYPIKQVTYEEWREALLSATEKSSDNPLSPLISTFAESNKPNKDTEENISRKLEANNTKSGLAETSIICPPCDRQLLSTYFSYLIDRGLLPKPLNENSKLS